MKHFNENRKFIENEFENAKYDVATGLSEDVLLNELCIIQETQTDTPRPIVCANAYAYLLDNVQLEINEHTPFSVKFNLGIDYSYFATSDVFQKAFFSKQRKKVLQEKLPEENQMMNDMKEAGFGYARTDFVHTVPDWSYLLEHGFCGILDNAKKSKAKFIASGNYEEGQINFLDSVIICYEAILRLLERIYKYSLQYNVPEFSECIKNLISNPPKTLYEVMQFSVLYLYFEEIGVERGRTLGPIDRMYLPYMQSDLKNGKSKEELIELFQYFFIHFTATKRFAEQPFTMCGCDKDGNDYTNELSLLLLEIYDELNIYDPKIHIRYHKNINKDILMKALSMIRGGNSSICFINDEVVYRGYERIGIPREDSQNYVILGCYEPIIMGLEEGEIATNRFNMVKCLEVAMNGGKDMFTGKQIGLESPLEVTSFEEFYDEFIKQLDYFLDFEVDFLQKQGKYSTLVNPSPIYSSSFSDCIEKGKDVHEYPLKYNNMSIKPNGIATVVDSLVAIKKYVFDNKEISFEDMRNAMLANWQGYEELQSKIVNDKEKYGNNLPVPDEIMTRITNHLEERYCGMKLERGGVMRLGLDSVYHCVNHGEKTAATPDGRTAGRPVSKNLCASDGMDKGGITGYMQSLLKINHEAYVGGNPLDFILHPSAVEGDKGLDDFASLVKVFFDNGGFALQGNIVSGATLKEAQKTPEKYSTLQVRVCGWNEYFVKLSKLKQDMFIKQCEVSGE